MMCLKRLPRIAIRAGQEVPQEMTESSHKRWSRKAIKVAKLSLIADLIWQTIDSK